MYRASIWVAAVVTMLASMALSYHGHFVWGAVLFVAALLIVGVGEVKLDRRRRREWFDSNFGTTEALAESVDVDALRTLRDEKGVTHAALKVRRQYPEIPLTEANRLVRDL